MCQGHDQECEGCRSEFGGEEEGWVVRVVVNEGKRSDVSAFCSVSTLLYSLLFVLYIVYSVPLIMRKGICQRILVMFVCWTKAPIYHVSPRLLAMSPRIPHLINLTSTLESPSTGTGQTRRPLTTTTTPQGW